MRTPRGALIADSRDPNKTSRSELTHYGIGLCAATRDAQFKLAEDAGADLGLASETVAILTINAFQDRTKLQQ
jgi:hypothetical protein